MPEPRAQELPGTQHQQGVPAQPEVELRRLRAECARLAGALVVRDDLDGYRQLERPDTVGATARAWQDVQWRIGELAAQLAAAQQRLDRADLLRQRRPADPPDQAGAVEPVARMEPAELAEPAQPVSGADLGALLRDPVEVVLTAATGAPVEVIRLPLPEVIVRAGEHHAAILAVAEAVAAARAAVFGQLGLVVEQFAELSTRAVAVAVPEALLAACQAELDTLRRAGDLDPLGADEGVAWTAARDRLGGRIAELRARVRRAEELRARWPSLVDELRLLIGRLDADETEVRQAWRGLTPLPGDADPGAGSGPGFVASASASASASAGAATGSGQSGLIGATSGAVRFGAPVPQAGALRVRLRAVERRCRHGEWWDAVEEESEPAEIGAAVTVAAEQAARARDVAGIHRQRLRDFRVELRGRLDAFQRKAFSLGRSEDLALADLYNEARRQLRADPFDASAADRAVTRYLHAVNEDGQA
jgi:hypothetical protein